MGHLFNSQVLMAHMSDDLTLVPTVFFFLWFVSTGIYLVRGGAAAVTSSLEETRSLEPGAAPISARP